MKVAKKTKQFLKHTEKDRDLKGKKKDLNENSKCREQRQ